jgi:glycosyltransferase involved in cell wall biosynthesis
VIASSSGGLGELLGTQGLTLVDPGEADALAHAVEQALPTAKHGAGRA